MLTAATLLSFCLAIIPIVVTPGASFTLVSARGVVGDRRGAWAVIAGTSAGIMTHAALAGIGLAAVVMRSAQLYQVLRLVGAAYLIGLGVVLVWRSRNQPVSERPGEVGTRRSGLMAEARRAYVANVLNVKAASVYLTLAPQFLPARAMGISAMLALAGVHILVMAVWLGAWSTSLTSLSRRFDAASWKRRIDQLGGVVLVGLGVRTATAR